jgi:hypothetical protein
MTTTPAVGWPCGYPEPEFSSDPANHDNTYILLFENELTSDDARGIAYRLIQMADEIDAKDAAKAKERIVPP